MYRLIPPTSASILFSTSMPTLQPTDQVMMPYVALFLVKEHESLDQWYVHSIHSTQTVGKQTSRTHGLNSGPVDPSAVMPALSSSDEQEMLTHHTTLSQDEVRCAQPVATLLWKHTAGSPSTRHIPGDHCHQLCLSLCCSACQARSILHCTGCIVQ
jgi:hypothetical protein